MRLEDWPLAHVRVKCAQCDREGRVSKVKLLERFGHDREMFVVRAKLTEPTCDRKDKKQPCMSILPDAMLVQAILAERKEDVLKPELIEEAMQYQPRWLKEDD
ncbi:MULTISPECIES: hypothetical protein [unclassified Bradyrhizobium]|uniref:hypothetical protein n=1 Tax=unclassified Bradyrhizobium TaxID=2631580 RepID=UPI002916AC55|nr:MULTISPECIES: hypothetical protein [unclassified Bradyrhizobium]